MGRLQRVVRRRRRSRQRALDGGARVVRAVAGGRRHEQRHRVGVLRVQPLRIGLERAAVRENPDRRQKRQALSAAKRTNKIQAILPGDFCRGILRAIDPRRHRDLAGRVRAQPHHDRLSGMAGEYFSGVAHAAETVAQPRDGVVEIELETIVVGRAVVLEGQAQITERLVGLEPERLPHRVSLCHRIRVGGHTREQQAPHFGQVLQGFGVVRIAWAAHPQRALVQLDAFAVDVAEHHGTKPAVTERQRLVPLARRVRIEEGVRRRLLCPGTGGKREHEHRHTPRRKASQHGWMVALTADARKVTCAEYTHEKEGPQ